MGAALPTCSTPAVSARAAARWTRRPNSWSLRPTSPSTSRGCVVVWAPHRARGAGPSGSQTSYTYNSGHPHAPISGIGGPYRYDANGNRISGGGDSNITWNGDNLPTSITHSGSTETYTYDGDGGPGEARGGDHDDLLHRHGAREGASRAGWRPTTSCTASGAASWRNGRRRAARTGWCICTPTTWAASAWSRTRAGSKLSVQDFTPWGSVRTGGVPASTTTLNYTGQQLDGTGLLYYNARYYDPALGRFISADSIVPGAASGAGGAADTLGPDAQQALRPLTVDFHEPGFLTGISQEDAFTQQKGFWFELSSSGSRQGEDSVGAR